MVLSSVKMNSVVSGEIDGLCAEFKLSSASRCDYRSLMSSLWAQENSEELLTEAAKRLE